MSLLTSASIVLAVPVPHAPAALRGTALDAARTAVVSSRTSGWTLNAYECPAGQRNAEASECKAAVQEAAQSAGLEVRGFIKNVDVGSEAGVPPGCSYSHASKGAIFNVNATGRSNGWYQGKSNDHYPWVCLNEGVQTDVQQSMGGGVERLPYPAWDPEQLVGGWWNGHENSLGVPDCNASGMHYYSLNGNYGRTNNALIEVAKALRYITQAEQPAALVLESAFASVLLPYDYVTAFKSWACVLMTVPAGVDFKELNAKQMYWSHSETEADDDFISAVLHQVMLRPLPLLRERVEAFEREQLVGPGQFNAVHLRWLEGNCIDWLSADQLGYLGVGQLECQDVPEATAEDVCSMSNAYLDAALRHTPGLPLFLADDGQQPNRTDVLVSERSAKRVPADVAEGQGLEMDMLLLIRSSHFVGNPASSLTLNVARVRSFHFGGNPASNLKVKCLAINAEEQLVNRLPRLEPQLTSRHNAVDHLIHY